MLIANRRLWVDAAKVKIVAEGSADAAYLLAGPGGPVPDQFADQLQEGDATEKGEATVGGITADRRLFVNADKTRLAEEGSEEAAHLLAAPGDLITSDFVERLKLELKDGKVVSALPAPEAEAEPEKVATRSRAKRGK